MPPGTTLLPFDQWVLVSSFITTIVTAFLIQVYWPKWAKAITAFIVSFIVAGVSLALQGQLGPIPATFDPGTFFFYGLAIFVAAIPIYEGLLKPLGLKDVEAATTLDQTRAQAYMAREREIGNDR